MSRWILGVDEVAWGAIAGDIVVGAFLAPDDWRGVPGLNDSKKLSPVERATVRMYLKAVVEEGLGFFSACRAVPAQPYDPRLADGLRTAARHAMRNVLASFSRAATGLKTAPVRVIMDGGGGVLTLDALPQQKNRKLTSESLVKADALIKQVMAASVLAKEARDARLLDAADKAGLGMFSWEDHKGYPTPQHLAELETYGPTSLHRPWTAPVKRWHARNP